MMASNRQTWYGMVGPNSGDLLTYGGKVIVHNNRSEMEFLFKNVRIARVNNVDCAMKLEEHPGMANVSFPLNRKDFR
jgi:hypothetical protein